MIIFRKYLAEDFNLVSNFLRQASIDFVHDDGIIYLAFDNEKLIGATKAKGINHKWYLDYIYVIEEERKNGLGDGLFRSILNNLRNENIKSIFFSSNSNYLINKGFCYNQDNELELNIDKFFSVSNCGSCGG